MTSQEILATVLTLPVHERARLAHEILVSLDEPEDPDAAAAWLAEITRRAREVETGNAALEDWSSVRERLLARRRGR